MGASAWCFLDMAWLRSSLIVIALWCLSPPGGAHGAPLLERGMAVTDPGALRATLICDRHRNARAMKRERNEAMS